MTPRPRRAITALAVLALTVFGVAGTTATAQASPHKTAHHSARHHGLQRFLALSTDASSDAAQVVIAKGPIHARGTDTVIDDHNDVFTFPAGSINVYHAAKHQHDSSDPVTCLNRHTENGTYKIKGGTGAYAAASGHGHYTVNVYFVGCSQTAPPDVFQLVIKASGPIHF